MLRSGELCSLREGARSKFAHCLRRRSLLQQTGPPQPPRPPQPQPQPQPRPGQLPKAAAAPAPGQAPASPPLAGMPPAAAPAPAADAPLMIDFTGPIPILAVSYRVSNILPPVRSQLVYLPCIKLFCARCSWVISFQSHRHIPCAT